MGVALAVVLAASAAPAHALVPSSYDQLPETKKEVWRGFQQWLAGGGSPSALTTAQQAEYDALVTSYNSTTRAGSASKAIRLKTAVRGLVRRTAGIRFSSVAMGTIPIVAAGVAAYTVGWTLRNMFFPGQGPTYVPDPAHPFTAGSVGLAPISKDDVLCKNGTTGCAIPAPEDGWVVTISNNKWFTDGANPCTEAPTQMDYLLNAGFEDIPTPQKLGQAAGQNSGTITCQPGDKNYHEACGIFGLNCNTHTFYDAVQFVSIDSLPAHAGVHAYNSGTDTPDRLKACPGAANVNCTVPTLPSTYDDPGGEVDDEITKPENDEIEKWVVYELDPDNPHPDPFGDDWPTLPAPLPNEVWTDYAARVETAGWPTEQVTRVVVSDANVDPTVGPNVVLRTAPEAGQQYPPDTQIKVYTNPDDAPVPSGAAWEPPTIRAIDLAPLNVSMACDAFPFGIFCWMGEGLTAWTSSESCPTFTVPFAHGDLDYDLCQFEPAMIVVRPVLLLLAAFSAAFMFAAAAMGFGGASNDD